jgi:hypothetical protein
LRKSQNTCKPGLISVVSSLYRSLQDGIWLILSLRMVVLGTRDKRIDRVIIEKKDA